MVELLHKKARDYKKRPRQSVGRRAPRHAPQPHSPAQTPTAHKPTTNWSPAIETDLEPHQPISKAELDAILLLLGDELTKILD